MVDQPTTETPTVTDPSSVTTSAPPTPPPPDAAPILPQGVMNALTNSLSTILKDALTQAMPAVVSALTNGVVQAKTEQNGKVGIGFSIDEAQLRKTVTEVGNNVKEELKPYLSKMGINFDVDFSDKLLPAIKKLSDQPLISGENLARAAGIDLLQTAINKFETNAMVQKYLNIEKEVKNFEKIATDANAGFALGIRGSAISLNGLGKDFDGVRSSINDYKESVRNITLETGLAFEKSQQIVNDFAKEGIAAPQMQEVSKTAKEAGKDVSGFTEMLYISKATGISTAEMAQNLALQTRSLGVETKDATAIYGNFADLSRKYNVRIQDIAKSTFEAAKNLKFYGDTTKGVTELYNKFIGSLGKGKESIATELVGNLVQGLDKMQPGLKAFIGMTTGIGKGRGAIGGALEVEDQIAQGNLGKVVEEMTSKIEQITGGKIVGRREALDTGQEQRFYMQRQLLHEFLGLGEQQAAQMQEAISKGLSIPIEELRPKEGLAVTEQIGQNVISETTGPVEAGLNMAKMSKVLDATDAISKDMAVATSNMSDGAASFKEASVFMRKLFGDTQSIKEALGVQRKTAKETQQANVEGRKAAQGGQGTQISEPVALYKAGETRGGASTTAVAQLARDQAGQIAAVTSEADRTTDAAFEEFRRSTRNKIPTIQEQPVPTVAVPPPPPPQVPANEITAATIDAVAKTITQNGDDVVKALNDNFAKLIERLTAQPATKVEVYLDGELIKSQAEQVQDQAQQAGQGGR